MPRTLLKKVLADLCLRKTRTFLVVLSIAVGVFALGAMLESHLVFSAELQKGYVGTWPANIYLAAEPFNADLVDTIRAMRQVHSAEGRRTVAIRVQTGAKEWKSLTLTAINEFDDLRVNKLKHLSGAWPPPERTLLLERSSLETFAVKEGDSLTVESADGKKRKMQVSGVVYDACAIPSFFSGRFDGYITLDTLQNLGETRDLSTLLVRTRPGDGKQLAEWSRAIWNKLEKSGIKVLWSDVSRLDKHPLEEIFDAMLFLLGFLAILSLLLSGFLLTNTVTAVLTEQTRQMGILKAVGATNIQIFGAYVITVLCYSALALIIAIPAGALGAYGLTFYQAKLANIDVPGPHLSLKAVVLQIALAIIVPLLAALIPLWRGVRVPVREALASYGIAGQRLKRHSRYLNVFLQRCSQAAVWAVETLLSPLNVASRPLLLSLRNAFRRKGRLILTLITLSLAGAAFIAVFSVDRSLKQTTDDVYEYYYQYDVALQFTDRQRIERIAQQALRVPGVVSAESWGGISARILRNRRDENDSKEVWLTAPSAATKVIAPQMMQGRWLVPDDENAAVVNTEMLQSYGPVQIGQYLTLKIRDQRVDFVVVGIAKSAMAGAQVYTNFPYFSRITREAGQATSLFVVTERHDAKFQSAVAESLEQRMKQSGLRVASLRTSSEMKQRILSRFDVLVIFLLATAGLLALVGALGLAGTMSIGVVERTREIGVMRAIGATNANLFLMIMTEGMLIGLMSWLLALIVAVPASKLLSDQVGQLFLEAPLTFRFSLGGSLLWLVLVAMVAAAATGLPARSAMRVSVRQSLSYE